MTRPTPAQLQILTMLYLNEGATEIHVEPDGRARLTGWVKNAPCRKARRGGQRLVITSSMDALLRHHWIVCIHGLRAQALRRHAPALHVWRCRFTGDVHVDLWRSYSPVLIYQIAPLGRAAVEQYVAEALRSPDALTWSIPVNQWLGA